MCKITFISNDWLTNSLIHRGWRSNLIVYLNFLNLEPLSWTEVDWIEPRVPVPDIGGICRSVEIIWSNVCIDYDRITIRRRGIWIRVVGISGEEKKEEEEILSQTSKKNCLIDKISNEETLFSYGKICVKRDEE